MGLFILRIISVLLARDSRTIQSRVIMITKNYNMIDWEANCRKKTPQNEEPKIGRKTITMLI